MAKKDENPPEEEVNQPENENPEVENESASEEPEVDYLAQFKLYVKKYGKTPATVHYFCMEMELDTDEFYQHFSSLKTLENEIWEDYFAQTYEMMTAQEVYEEYSARERLLSFYYTLFEVLRKERSYTGWKLEQMSAWNGCMAELAAFEKHFLNFVEGILAEGMETGEVESRMFLSDRYAKMHKHQLRYLLRFWANDTSAEYQSSDEAVEKSVNLGFDLMGKNVFDSAFDFVKFSFQK